MSSLTPNRDGAAGTAAAMRDTDPGYSPWLGGHDRQDTHADRLNVHSAHLGEHDDRLDEHDDRLAALEAASHEHKHSHTDVENNDGGA